MENKQNSVLAVLASKEKTIEALRREMAEKEQREGKLKGQVLKLRALIQPLRDELANQKEERKEEMMKKCLLIDKLKEKFATVEMKLKKMKKTKEEVEKKKRSKRTLTVGAGVEPDPCSLFFLARTTFVFVILVRGQKSL